MTDKETTLTYIGDVPIVMPGVGLVRKGDNVKMLDTGRADFDDPRSDAAKAARKVKDERDKAEAEARAKAEAADKEND